MTNPIREIYQQALKETKSKQALLGQFKGMEQMYLQENQSEEDLMEIQKIIQEIKSEM